MKRTSTSLCYILVLLFTFSLHSASDKEQAVVSDVPALETFYLGNLPSRLLDNIMTFLVQGVRNEAKVIMDSFYEAQDNLAKTYKSVSAKKERALSALCRGEYSISLDNRDFQLGNQLIKIREQLGRYMLPKEAEKIPRFQAEKKQERALITPIRMEELMIRGFYGLHRACKRLKSYTQKILDLHKQRLRSAYASIPINFQLRMLKRYIRTQYFREVESAVMAGINLDARYKEGETLLTRAIRRKNPGLVKELLLLGANVNVPNAAGKLPIEMAYEKQNYYTMNQLLHAGAIDKTGFYRRIVRKKRLEERKPQEKERQLQPQKDTQAPPQQLQHAPSTNSKTIEAPPNTAKTNYKNLPALISSQPILSAPQFTVSACCVVACGVLLYQHLFGTINATVPKESSKRANSSLKKL